MPYHFISYDIGTREGISTNEKYAGGFNKITGPTSNLLPDDNPRTSKYSGERCVNYYLKQGATPRKLVLGMPLYGTGWNGTEGMYTNWTSESFSLVVLSLLVSSALFKGYHLGARETAAYE